MSPYLTVPPRTLPQALAAYGCNTKSHEYVRKQLVGRLYFAMGVRERGETIIAIEECNEA